MMKFLKVFILIAGLSTTLSASATETTEPGCMKIAGQAAHQIFMLNHPDVLPYIEEYYKDMEGAEYKGYKPDPIPSYEGSEIIEEDGYKTTVHNYEVEAEEFGDIFFRYNVKIVKDMNLSETKKQCMVVSVTMDGF